MESREHATTIQLRRYQIEPGRMADHVAWFPTIRAARELYGFRVLFAFADYQRSVFTWAVSFDGGREEFAAFDAAWSASPGRAAAFDTNPRVVTSMETDVVSDVMASAVQPA